MLATDGCVTGGAFLSGGQLTSSVMPGNLAAGSLIGYRPDRRGGHPTSDRVDDLPPFGLVFFLA
jgi:hypothetical protein